MFYFAHLCSGFVFEQLQNLGRRFGLVKYIYPPPPMVASAAVHSKAVVLLLLIHFLLLRSLFFVCSVPVL